MARGPCRDLGSATVWVVAALASLCVVCGAFLWMGQAVLSRHRAAGAADLAALAAADHAGEGRKAACERAARVAGAQGARLVRCAIAGEVSDVSVAAGMRPFVAEVRARAGPAGGPDLSPAPGHDSPPSTPDRPGERTHTGIHISR
ncbi:Rv3654c family TadE-like protein [Streptomyces sp. NA04227]|uniref:Rv3654c family TadE-like protein n=1 Tax=Streptomyces sp. NA04227 TaxID=2742136 RepID=UPI0020CA31D1|nr:Rv3654c family TadE-like protein [Streptomyces sp. NA04227]